MKTVFKKIITPVLILSILFSPSLSSLEKSSAQTEEAFKMSCEKEAPVGEALSLTKDLTNTLIEDLDFMLIAFLKQEHAVKRVYKLSQGAGSLIDWWGLAESLIPYLSDIAEVYGQVKCAVAAEQILESTIKLSNAINKTYMGYEGVKEFKKDYEDIKGAINKARSVFSQGFDKVKQGVSETKTGIGDIKEAGTTIKDNYKDIEKIKTGYEQINNNQIIAGLMNLITGIKALNKVILAMRTIDESLGLINGEVQKGEVQKVLVSITDGRGQVWEWQCLDYRCEKGQWTCSGAGHYQTLQDCLDVCMWPGSTCTCPEEHQKEQTGLCLIQAQFKSIENVLNLISELKESLEKIRDGIDGIIELPDALEGIDDSIDKLPEDCREKLPSQLIAALDTAQEIKEKIEPIITDLVEMIDKDALQITRDLINGAIEVLLLLEKDVEGETVEKVSESISLIIKDVRYTIQSIREKIPKIPTVNELFWGLLKGIKKKIASFTGEAAEDVKNKINDIFNNDQETGLNPEGAATSTDITDDTDKLDKNASSTHSATEDNEENLETGSNRLEGTFNLLDTGIEETLEELAMYFEEISILGIFNLETLLDLTGFNQCLCQRCPYSNPCIIILGVPIPLTSYCWGLACPYGEIKTYVNSIGALQSGDWGWAPENVYYWLNGQKKGRLTYMKETWEELNGLIRKEEKRIWREGEPEELSLGGLTNSEFYLIIKELAGKELEDCFVTTEMFEKGESLKYLFSCETALKENLIPQSIYEPGTEGWKKTIEGRCYQYPNNFVCCQ